MKLKITTFLFLSSIFVSHVFGVEVEGYKPNFRALADLAHEINKRAESPKDCKDEEGKIIPDCEQQQVEDRLFLEDILSDE